MIRMHIIMHLISSHQSCSMDTGRKEMKVKDIVKKINYGSSELPLFLQEGALGKMREVTTSEYENNEYAEANYTANGITLKTDKVIIHYWDYTL